LTVAPDAERLLGALLGGGVIGGVLEPHEL